MKHWKTNLVGALKLVGAVAFVVFKLANGKPLTDEDVALVTLAIGGGLGNLVGADSKPAPADPPNV